MHAVTVLGGGVAGLATSLLLARDGNEVRLVDRDAFEVGEPESAADWRRRGIPHFLQPHAFIPRGRKELKELLPDIHTALLAAGASDVDARSKIPGPRNPLPGDEDLQYLAVRRPLLEWALRRAVADEPGIDVHDGVTVEGLVVEDGRITGVQVDGGVGPVGVVVDALGRRSPTPGWLSAAGVDAPSTETSDCGVVYYSRYYRQRPGFELPEGPWALSPRGDLGYLGWATFPGDNRTLAALLAVPHHVAEWRVLADERAFEAAVAAIPALAAWTDPEGVEPITGVLPMAGLTNSFRPAVVDGLLPVGDARSHTDPSLAYGLTFSLLHAAAVVAALRDDPEDAARAYDEATAPALRERYDLATALDGQRRRAWTGETVDFTHHDGDYELFSMAACSAASMVDADVFRMFVRRMGLLDGTGVLDDDVALQCRIEGLFAGLRATPRPPPGPARQDMVSLANEALRR